MPDAYEENLLKRLATKLPVDASLTEWIDNETTLRSVTPIYYSQDCLVCHGNPKGILDISGYPREGAKEGDLAGAAFHIPKKKTNETIQVYANPQEDYEAVEPGWSWNACGFGPFWALSKKMWAVGVGVFGALVAIWGVAAASMGHGNGASQSHHQCGKRGAVCGLRSLWD